MRKSIDDLADGERWRVWLNGKQVSKVVEFDTDEGWIVRYKTDEHDQIIPACDENNDWWADYEKLIGTVTAEQYFVSVAEQRAAYAPKQDVPE